MVDTKKRENLEEIECKIFGRDYKILEEDSLLGFTHSGSKLCFAKSDPSGSKLCFGKFENKKRMVLVGRFAELGRPRNFSFRSLRSYASEKIDVFAQRNAGFSNGKVDSGAGKKSREKKTCPSDGPLRKFTL